MLTIENSIPIGWSSADLQVDQQTILDIQESNKQLLFVLLEKHKNHSDLEKESDDTSHELKLLQHKVDLLTSWLGKLLINQMTLPSNRKVQISSKGIIIATDAPLEIHEKLQLECYLEPNFPQALLFFGQVKGIEAVENGKNIVIDFVNLGAEVSDLLDKLIFQNHRRLVAYSKSKEL